MFLVKFTVLAQSLIINAKRKLYTQHTFTLIIITSVKFYIRHVYKHYKIISLRKFPSDIT